MRSLRLLRSRGVEVLLLADLLTEALAAVPPGCTASPPPLNATIRIASGARPFGVAAGP